MEKILVLDFGGQYNQLIARRVREQHVYAEIKPYNKITPADILAAGYAGVIFTGGPNSVYDPASPHYDPAVLELVGSDIPLVTIDYTFDGHSAVISDNVQAMDQLTEYVIGCGHRKIAFICGESTAVTRSRKAAFHRACRRHGLEIPDAYLISGIYHDPKTSGLATRELLALKEPPTCILYPDDISLLGGMTEIERHGLRIPDDISIVGFDGIPLSRVLRPSLTTLCQDSETLGTRAAQLLIEAIEEPKLFVPRVVTVPGWVQPGQTVKKLS